MTTHLVWLRNDLRVQDNIALYAACQDAQARVLAVYIATPGQWRQHAMSARQAAFIYANLQAVQQALAQRGIPMHYHQCDDFAAVVPWLQAFCQQHQIDDLFYNYQYEVNERDRDRAVEQALQGHTRCQGFDDSLLLAPGSVQTGSREMFKVYTPFRNAFLRHLAQADPACLPAPEARSTGPVSITFPLTPFDYPCQPVDETFPAGEEAALARLRHFCHHQVQDYRRDRDLPALDGTSRLSAYLVVGVLSPRQCWNRLRTAFPAVMEQPDSGAFTWLNELVWREFYRHLLVAWPALCRHQPFISWTRLVEWQSDDATFRAWQEGRTGFPIVDAAMRQMASTGWMHNRLRMITASFLVKDLLIDWRRGEQWFMQQLIDGDLAANNGGWQWAASTGTDSAPYFRIFNPTTQGQRFDEQGEFIRRWLPELTAVPDQYLHQPHSWPRAQQAGLDYPQPIVDHSLARKRALAAYQDAKARGARSPL